MIQQFLQVHHVHCFSESYLASYLDIPEEQIHAECERLVAVGFAFRPEHTSYIQSVAVDWAAVHAGEALMPVWAKDSEVA